MPLFGNAYSRSMTPTLNALLQMPLVARNGGPGSVRDPLPNALGQSVRAYHPTPADWARNALASVLQSTGQMPGEARRTSELATAFTPVGMAEGVNDGLLTARRGVENGSVKQTLGGILSAALNAGPGGTAKGMFLGVLAKNADRVALAKAEKMLANGADRQAIWDATGWFKGADDKWRFEINDSKARFRPNDEVQMKRGNVTLVKSFGPHPELYGNYPDVASVPVKAGYGMTGYKAAWQPDAGAILMEASRLGGNKEDLRSILAHETQHVVQTKEGFARGGNMTESVADELQGIMNRKAELYASGATRPLDDWYNGPQGWRASAAYGNPPESVLAVHPAIPEYIDLLKREEVLRLAGQGYYKRLAGEVEARNVQKRLNMTPEQRRVAPPWASQDTPDEQQIVRFKP